MNIKIAGTGVYLPDKIIKNEDIFTTEECKIIEKLTGIRERRNAPPSMTTSDMAAHAAREALGNARPQDIDLIILSTTSPDMFFPSTACLTQAKINAKNAFAFDISASCSGFIYALQTARQFIKTGSASRALVISSEIKSRFISENDRDTYPLFGDGAAAALLVREDDPESGIIDIDLKSDGKFADMLHLKIDRADIYEDPVKNRPVIKMNGGRLFRKAVSTLQQTVKAMLDKHSMTVADIDRFIFHQANGRILQNTAERLGIPSDKISISLDRLGNTSSASIPVTMHQSIKEGKIKKGDTIMLASFGGGLTWGAALLKI